MSQGDPRWLCIAAVCGVLGCWVLYHGPGRRVVALVKRRH